MKESNFLRSALTYVQDLQWPVFPLKPQSKEPLTQHGYKDATLDQKIIQSWWRKTPRANIGTPTGIRFWVLDIDPRHGGDESLAKLVLKHGMIRDTLRQMTGGGGSHYFYELPDQQKIGCPKSPWPGIDIKGEGGYVALPPSVHPETKKKYSWDSIKRSILEETINPADPWLIQEITATNHPGGEPFNLPKRIPKGQQHTTLFQMGCAMRRKGCGYDEILEALWTVNERRCEQPGPRANIEKLAQSICKQYPAGNPAPKAAKPTVVLPEPRTVDQLLDLDIKLPEMLIEGLLPRRGLALMTGAQRSGKTIYGAQLAISIARNQPLFDYYSLKAHGPVIVMEKDDPGGDASFKDLYLRAKVPRGTPIHYYGPDRIPIPLGTGFLEWLQFIVPKTGAVLVVLDSYTALRPTRKPGGDIVQEERREISQLDALAKQLNCLILLLHHESITTRANGSLDWDARGAGTYGMTMAAECQIAITRYRDLAIDAPERLLRFRSRHLKDVQLTLRYEQETGLFEFVIDGGAAPLYAIIFEIKRQIHKSEFVPKDLEEPLGISRATAFRYLASLVSANAVWRNSKEGTYQLSPDIERLKV